MELNFITVLLSFGVSFTILRIVVHFLFRENKRPNIFVWFIVGGLLGVVSRSWWASEVFIVDTIHNQEEDNKKYFIGNYKGHEVALFHKYVDNCMTDTLIAYSSKYWENDDSLEYTIILPFSFSEIGGSIDYYNLPPPESIKIPSFPFWNPHVKRWTLCRIETYYYWIDNPIKWDE